MTLQLRINSAQERRPSFKGKSRILLHSSEPPQSPALKGNVCEAREKDARERKAQEEKERKDREDRVRAERERDKSAQAVVQPNTQQPPQI